MIEIQEREMWNIAAFRLRESAKRIHVLSVRVTSPELRAQLLSIYVRIRADEEKLSALAERIVITAHDGGEVHRAGAAGIPSDCALQTSSS